MSVYPQQNKSVYKTGGVYSGPNVYDKWGGGSGNVVNIGGRNYPYIEIDGKKWISENLDFAPSGISVGISSYTTAPNAGYYNNDPSTYGENGYKCGLLYNWYAVKYLNDNRNNFFPNWRIPTANDYANLASSVGTSTAGKKLKASNLSWAPNWGGIDDYLFTMLPGGGYFGSFLDVQTRAYLWTIDEKSATQADGYRFTESDTITLYANRNKNQYYSIRLMSD